MKREFFTALEALNPNLESWSLTCLSPAHLGEKAIYAGGKAVYREKTDGFFAALDNVGGFELPAGCGIFPLAGETVYGERLGHEKKLIICGAGHVSIAVIRIAKLLGLHVICIEDRPLFADHARAAGADEVLCEDFAVALTALPGDSDSYFVIVTRGHRYDRDCLRIIAGKKHAYIGLMGSRRRVQLVKESLIAEGVSKEVLESVHTPIGLAIGAETPEEIAVSVMAEIIAVKNGTQKNCGFPEEILKSILVKEEGIACGKVSDALAAKASQGTPPLRGTPMIMCSIISRKGSAPRQVGTKMLLLADGRCVGTIGGGCIEAEVVRRGRALLLSEAGEPGAENAVILPVDLTAEMAADEGMVCGGKVEVLLERIEGPDGNMEMSAEGVQ